MSPTPPQEGAPDRRVFLWNVIASVVASILFLAFIQPLLIFLWDALLSSGSQVLKHYVDSLYANAAVGNRNWVIAIIALGLLYVPYFNVLMLAILRPKLKAWAEATRAENRERVGRRARYVLIAVSLVGLGVATWPASWIFTDIQLNASFNQRLDALSPYLSDRQLREFRSSWARMKSKSDHKKIRLQMEEVAKQSGITLPEQLLED